MRKMKKEQVLKMLGKMVGVVERLPDKARIGRVLMVDNGQGLILERGIEEAAQIFRKTLEAEKWPNGWEILKFRVGELEVWQIKGVNWK